jgi:outer membrane immunogenic protein
MGYLKQEDKLMKSKLTAAALVALMIPAAANAADLSTYSNTSTPDNARKTSWSGFYVGGQVGYGNTNHDLNATGATSSCDYKDEQNNPAVVYNVSKDECAALLGRVNPGIKYKTYDPSSAYLDGINSRGFFGGLNAGFDLQRGKLVFGLLGQYNFSAIKSEAGVLGTDYKADPIDVAATIDEGDSWLLGGRVGYLVDDRALLYILGGYGQMDMKYTVTDNIENDSGSLEDTISGWTLGAGAEFALTHNLFLGLEYQHFFGNDKVSLFTMADDGINLTDDIDSDKVMVTLKAKLNSDVFGN